MIIPRIKIPDIICILIFLAVIVLSFIRLGVSGNEKTPELFVQTPEEKFIYSLNADGTYEFKGILGTTTVLIKDGRAKVTDSPCENKTCILTGEIYRDGQWAACLPNGIILHIEGKKDSGGFDAVAE